MQKIFFLITLLFIASVSKGQSYNYLGTFNTQGVPNYLTTSDTIPPALLTNIASSLPENFPVPVYNPQYISPSNATSIYMQNAGDVYVTFVDEGAGYKNVLGYYAYPATNPPATIPSNSNLNIIFPNVSKLNSGGGLLPGHKVHLGYFAAGTTISWFLIANGFSNGAVTNGNWRLFSNVNFNPESTTYLRYHNVLLYDSTFNKIILGFEDIRRDYSSCDNDFNDAIFYVTSTPAYAIQTSNMISTVSTTNNTSSGNDGGLESNGGLASLIARRNFEKNNKIPQNEYDKQASYNEAKAVRSELAQFIPDLSNRKLEMKISSPTDLISITNATDVLSVDYYNEEKNRVGAILLTATNENVYNHTKAICDRLKGAKLLNISNKQYGSINYITYQLLQSNGEKEFVTCFSISADSGKFTFHNNWLLSQYPLQKAYFNFQIWSNTPHLNQLFVDTVLEKLINTQQLQSNLTLPAVPSTYLVYGELDQDSLRLTIQNSAASEKCTLILNRTSTEFSSRSKEEYEVNIAPYGISTIAIPCKNLFDTDIALWVDGVHNDDVYLADGAWGIDYIKNNSFINKFEIAQHDNEITQGTYTIARQAIIDASIGDYVTLYKMLKPSSGTANLTKYKFANFNIISNEEITVRFNKSSIHNWNEQATAKLKPQNGIIHLSIPLSSLLTSEGKIYQLNDISNISFTINNSNSNILHTHLEIKHASFSNSPKFETFVNSAEMHIYPNPIIDASNFFLQIPALINGRATLQISDMQGIHIASQEISTVTGNHIQKINLTQPLKPGIYVAKLIGENIDLKCNMSVR